MKKVGVLISGRGSNLGTLIAAQKHAPYRIALVISNTEGAGGLARAAEAGIFSLDRVPLFTENHRKSGGKSSLSDYYQAAYSRVSFDKSLRRNVVFSDHSLVTDAAFAEMHLISCRNVMIYFDRALQNRVLGLFKDSLARKGFLGVGAKESLRFSEHAASFAEFVREEKIYQRRIE